MSKTVVEKLADYGQSIWLDNLSRYLIESGKLKELVAMGVRGVTSILLFLTRPSARPMTMTKE